LSQEALAVVYRTQRERKRDMFEEISAERERERDGFGNKLAKKKENLGVVLLEFVEEEVESDADISV
jgi:hypothetical protein